MSEAYSEFESAFLDDGFPDDIESIFERSPGEVGFAEEFEKKDLASSMKQKIYVKLFDAFSKSTGGGRMVIQEQGF